MLVNEKGVKVSINSKNIARKISDLTQIINKLVFAGPVVVTVEREARSLSMNAKQHAMYTDISATTVLRGRKYKAKVWKTLLVDEFEKEYELSVGEKLPHAGSWVISLSGNYPVRDRPETSLFNKKIGSMLIMFLYKKGDEYGATFKYSSFDHYKEAEKYLRSKKLLN